MVCNFIRFVYYFSLFQRCRNMIHAVQLLNPQQEFVTNPWENTVFQRTLKQNQRTGTGTGTNSMSFSWCTTKTCFLTTNIAFWKRFSSVMAQMLWLLICEDPLTITWSKPNTEVIWLPCAVTVFNNGAGLCTVEVLNFWQQDESLCIYSCMTDLCVLLIYTYIIVSLVPNKPCNVT